LFTLSAFVVTKAAAVRLALDSEKNGSLELEQEGFVQKAIEHALKYGKVTSTAYVDVDGAEVTDEWRSSAEKEAKVTKVRLDDEGRVTRESLNDALREQERDDDSR
jgi:cysteine sulfinate desulfinase/cysteine desulfurase-like protein